METVTCTAALQHPFTCILSGPTQSGKTEWVLKLLENRKIMIEPPVEKILYCYGEQQEKLERLSEKMNKGSNSNIFSLHEGLPTREMLDRLSADDAGKLLILDDLMEDVQQNELVAELFTRGSHHRNLSVLLITQNLFVKGRYQRTISLNANYLVVMKNPRDRSQITYLGRQMFPDRWQLVQQAYEMATERPHGYLFIDLTQSMDDRFRFRTNIFNEQTDSAIPHLRGCTIFIPPAASATSESGSRKMFGKRYK